MAYTYDDFLAKLNQSGLAGQFSQADMDTALQYPEFGMSMISAKQNYANAQTQEGRDMANALAEQLRSSYGNYVGGSDGSGYMNLGRKPSDYQSRYGSAIDDAINELNNYGSFSYGAAPTYTSRYDEQMNDLLNQLVNRQPYLYNLETDPVWSAYKKQYTREGQRATADTLAQMATMTGGMPSSWAVNAATQAGDYYASQMTDMIPTLYQQAYDRYLSEYTMKQNDLAAVQSMEQMDYGKYQDQLQQYNTDRNLAYSQWQDEYNMLSNNIGVMQGQDATEYDRYLTDLDWNAQQQAIQREQNAAAAQNAAAQVDAMLAAGGTPSAQLVAQAGYNQEYVDAMAAYYAKEAALAAAGSGGSGSKSASSGESESTESVFEMIYANGWDPADYWYSTGGAGTAANVEAFVNNYNSWLRRQGNKGSDETTQTGAGTATAGQKNSVMNEVSRQVAAGNPLGAMEQLLVAAQSGIISEEEVVGLANAMGLGSYLSVG